jgi:hypothetical protein
MENILIILAVVLIVGLALAYVIRVKKKGTKCIGCPSGGNCGSCAGKDSCGVNGY